MTLSQFRRPAAPIGPAEALRHDPFEAELAGLGEDDSALGVDRLAERNAVDPGDERREFGPADLERELAPILAVDVQKIERDERGLGRAPRRSQAAKSLCPSGRNTTASPSSKASATGRARTASAILGMLSVRSVPRRDHKT